MKIDCRLLIWCLECRKTTSGTTYYLVHVGSLIFRFTSLEAVFDFLNHNDFGTVHEK